MEIGSSGVIPPQPIANTEEIPETPTVVVRYPDANCKTIFICNCKAKHRCRKIQARRMGTGGIAPRLPRGDTPPPKRRVIPVENPTRIQPGRMVKAPKNNYAEEEPATIGTE